jgi:FkbH-like protein
MEVSRLLDSQQKLRPRTKNGPHGGALAAQRVRALEDAAATLAGADPGFARQLAAALAAPEADAARWLRAALLERLGDPSAAAHELAAISPEPEADAMRLTALCRARLAAGASDEAVEVLRDAVRAAGSYRLQAANARLLARLEREGKPAARRACRLAMVGNATFGLLAPVLRVTAFAAGIDLTLYAGSYGQQAQEILDPDSPLRAFAPEVVLLATDWRSLGLSEETSNPDAAVAEALAGLRALWRQCRERWGAFVIQHNFEVPETTPYGRLSAAAAGGRARVLQRINLALEEAVAEEPGVTILSLEQAAAAWGKRRWSRAAEWQIARQYPAAGALPELARRQVALLRAVLGLSAKVLVLDLDGVLWGGVVGEDGVRGITLGNSGPGEAYVEFQRYVQALGRRGVLLAACSKNNAADARAPFLSHSECVLALDDFAAFEANWEPKDANLRRVAAALNVGLDSLVFVDDSPVERAWVRRRLPEVEVVPLPSDPSEFVAALDRGRHFEALLLTEEDRQRSQSLRANAAREAARGASGTLEEFLTSLKMAIELHPFREEDLPRIVQLIQKTNQFNLTVRRHGEAEVRRLAEASGNYTQTLRLRDRFGDSGLVGVMIAARSDGALWLDTWLLSCRVLGRRVPEAAFAALCRYAQATGCRMLVGEYRPTARNASMAGLFEQMGFTCFETASDGVRRFRREVPRDAEFPACFTIRDHTQPASCPVGR